jgi:4-diphosphocytidyl-2-C-methyl-D-erythritol kinase
VKVSTAAIFNDSGLTRNTPRIRIPTLFKDGLNNDLEPVTCRLYPEVGEALSWLRQFGEARMTGSGCGLFVAVSDRQSGEEILGQAPAGISGFVAAGINQHPLRTTEPVGV